MNGGRICRAVLQVLSSGVPCSPAWPWLEWHLWGGSYALPEMETEGAECCLKLSGEGITSRIDSFPSHRPGEKGVGKWVARTALMGLVLFTLCS